MSSKIQYEPMPPEQAIKFFKSKGYAIGFDWRDVWKEEHAIAFTVAKAASIDLLQDIRGELDKALKQGLTFESFKKNLKPLLVQRGWWGKAAQTDPLTGEEKEVMLGSNRRLKTIWRTNIDMAYAAGNWQNIEATKRSHPFLQYKNRDPARARPQHKAWNDIVLRSDDPWWDTHYPPNGWNCKCWVRQVSKNEVESGRFRLSKAPATQTVPYRNKRTGEMLQVPEGIDPGFDYNVGKARARAFTPPPLGGLPQTNPYQLSNLPPMPKPSPLPPSPFLDKNLSNSAYMQAFLSEFKCLPGKTVYYTDKCGDILPINENLFITKDGYNKVNKNDRGQYMKLLALGIIDPDEVWLQWVKTASGGWLLKKRFVKIWDAGKGSHCLSVFDKTTDGWQGATVFPPASSRSEKQRDAYVNKYRGGLLMYKK